MEHHLIAIAGYASSELANVFGLANAVNTWITEAARKKGGRLGSCWKIGWYSLPGNV